MSDYGVVPDDIRGVTSVKGVSDPQIVGFISDAGGEIDTIFAGKGVTTPVTGNADLVNMIRSAIKWGAAGKTQDAPILSSPYNSSQLINIYMQEYKRLIDQFIALTPAQLYALGVAVVLTAPPTQPTVIGLGLGTVANRNVGNSNSWSNFTPVYKVAGLPDDP